MDSNNTTLDSSVEIIKCFSPLNFCLLYFQLSIAIAGFLLNLICVRVFVKLLSLKGNNNDLFRYLSIKSAADAYILFVMWFDQIFDPDEYYGQRSLKEYVDKLYFLKVTYLIFGFYCGYSLRLISIFSEVLSVFNRYRLLTKRFDILNKLPFGIVCLGIFSYSFGFYSYKFFSIKIINFNNFSSENNYEYVKDKELDNKMGYIHSGVRDGMCVLVILVINILTMVEIKKLLKKKKKMFKEKNKQKNHMAEIRLTIMVFVLSFIGVLAHSLQMVQYFSPDYFFFNTNECFIILFDLIFNACSFPFNFFLYYFFNLKFKKHFSNMVFEFLNLFGLKKATQPIPVSHCVSVQQINIIED